MSLYPSCKFRTGIECGSDECDKCGWNPIVEAEREQKLRNGAVKSYLKIDLGKLNNKLDYMHQKNRKNQKEVENCGAV